VRRARRRNSISLARVFEGKKTVSFFPFSDGLHVCRVFQKSPGNLGPLYLERTREAKVSIVSSLRWMDVKEEEEIPVELKVKLGGEGREREIGLRLNKKSLPGKKSRRRKAFPNWVAIRPLSSITGPPKGKVTGYLREGEAARGFPLSYRHLSGASPEDTAYVCMLALLLPQLFSWSSAFVRATNVFFFGRHLAQS